MLSSVNDERFELLPNVLDYFTQWDNETKDKFATKKGSLISFHKVGINV